jgi:hypothetical protein
MNLFISLLRKKKKKQKKNTGIQESEIYSVSEEQE